MEATFTGTCHIIENLFIFELEEILLKIFLFLDPKSLKNSKGTCTKWREFIDRRIWKSKSGLLDRKLFYQWKTEKPEKCQYKIIPDYVHFLLCDQTVSVICSKSVSASFIGQISPTKQSQISCQNSRRNISLISGNFRKKSFTVLRIYIEEVEVEYDATFVRKTKNQNKDILAIY